MSHYLDQAACSDAQRREDLARNDAAERLRARLMQLFIYDPVAGTFTRKAPARGASVGSVVGHIDSRGYMTLLIDGKAYRAHRLAWLYVHGVLVDEIDHRNRIKTDFRIDNLRHVTHCENMQNAVTGPKSRTGVRGVAHHPVTGKFAAYISRNRKKRWLGVYATVEEAAAVRRAAEQEYAQ